MSHTEKFTLSTLQAFSGCDFEELREHGEAARLTRADATGMGVGLLAGIVRGRR